MWKLLWVKDWERIVAILVASLALILRRIVDHSEVAVITLLSSRYRDDDVFHVEHSVGGEPSSFAWPDSRHGYP